MSTHIAGTPEGYYCKAKKSFVLGDDSCVASGEEELGIGFQTKQLPDRGSGQGVIPVVREEVVARDPTEYVSRLKCST